MWLGLDLGTSAVKAVLVDDAGTVTCESGAPLALSRPRPGWSEQDPDDWWRATRAAIAGLPAAGRAAVRGLGLAGQMHGATLLDAQDRALRPAILWNDGRASEECRELERREPRSRAITGNRAMAGFTAPKLLWVARHEPEVFSRVARVLLPKDHLRLRLTGESVSEPSDAAGTLWLDTAGRSWSAAMLEASGLAEGNMPRLVEGNEVSGTLRRPVAEELGLPRVPVSGGGGDNASGAVGVGAIEPGDGFVSLGTSGVVFVVSDGFRPNPADAVHAFCHALPERWHQMAVILSAASAVEWAARLVGFADVPTAIRAAAALPAGAPHPVMLPYLSGERTPHDDPAARGVLFGLGSDQDGAAVVAAALEGVAFAIADGMDALRAAGTAPERLTLIGGGSRSGRWADMIAAASGVTLERIEGGQTGPALGAARLARMAAAGEAADRVCPKPASTEVHVPEPELADRLRPRRALYRALYDDVSERFQEYAKC